MVRGILAIGLLASLPVVAALDKIDADGVTEVGGSSEYARMLPRTKSDGKLDMSLLPPVADWASQPIPGLYYVSSGMAEEGNGSPQYPFKTVTTALSVAKPGSAILVVPGTYSGAGTIQNGKSLAICGFGKDTCISELTVEAVGTATLRLCGVSVGTLRINGGNLSVWLSGTCISTLAGASEGVTVTRTDMGSRVDFASIASYTDSYAGNDTSEKANQLVGPVSTGNLKFSGSRLKVGDVYTVAYVADVNAATNALDTKFEELEDEDTRLSGLITTETGTRAAADLALSNSLNSSVSDLNTRITGVSTNWNTQLNTVVLNVSRLNTTVTALQQKETNDVATLTSSITSVRTGYAAADTALDTSLRAKISDSVGDLRDDVPGIAEAQATTVVEDVTPSIVSEAVDKAYTNSVNLVSGVSSRVTVHDGKISSLEATSTKHTSSISSLSNTTVNLSSRITSLDGKVEQYNTARVAEIGNLNTWRTSMSAWQIQVNSTNTLYKSYINQILGILRKIKAGESYTVPDDIP